MWQGSSNPASPSKPVTASEQQETLTTVSHVFDILQVSASLEALDIEIDRKPTVVHCTQASFSPGASTNPWSLNAKDHQRSTQATPLKLKRYALQIWLEVEVGPGYFLPPEDDSYSMDFALEVRIIPIQVAWECIWIEEAICWPSMAGKAAQRLASSRMWP